MQSREVARKKWIIGPWSTTSGAWRTRTESGCGLTASHQRTSWQTALPELTAALWGDRRQMGQAMCRPHVQQHSLGIASQVTQSARSDCLGTLRFRGFMRPFASSKGFPFSSGLVRSSSRTLACTKHSLSVALQLADAGLMHWLKKSAAWIRISSTTGLEMT